MNNLLKYTNGRGHLAMSIVCMVAGVLIIIFAAAYAGYAITLMSMVASAWFVPGAARQVAEHVKEEMKTVLPDAPLQGGEGK